MSRARVASVLVAVASFTCKARTHADRSGVQDVILSGDASSYKYEVTTKGSPISSTLDQVVVFKCPLEASDCEADAIDAHGQRTQFKASDADFDERIELWAKTKGLDLQPSAVSDLKRRLMALAAARGTFDLREPAELAAKFGSTQLGEAVAAGLGLRSFSYTEAYDSGVDGRDCQHTVHAPEVGRGGAFDSYVCDGAVASGWQRRCRMETLFGNTQILDLRPAPPIGAAHVYDKKIVLAPPMQSFSDPAAVRAFFTGACVSTTKPAFSRVVDHRCEVEQWFSDEGRPGDLVATCNPRMDWLGCRAIFKASDGTLELAASADPTDAYRAPSKVVARGIAPADALALAVALVDTDPSCRR